MRNFWNKCKVEFCRRKDVVQAKSYVWQIEEAVVKYQGVCIICSPTRAQFHQIKQLLPNSWPLVPVFKNDKGQDSDRLEFLTIGINPAALWFGWCDFKKQNQNNETLTIVERLNIAKAESIIRTFLVKNYGIKIIDD